MPKIQIDLSKEENKVVEVYKLVHDLKTKQEAIKQMIHELEHSSGKTLIRFPGTDGLF